MGIMEKIQVDLENTKQVLQSMTCFNDRLSQIEASLDFLVKQRVKKEMYTTTEVAHALGKHVQTVRSWCVNKRVNAVKQEGVGRGVNDEWRITHDELERIKNEGLLNV